MSLAFPTSEIQCSPLEWLVQVGSASGPSQRLNVNVLQLPSAALGIVTFLKGARTQVAECEP